jgi:hypothetical protein
MCLTGCIPDPNPGDHVGDVVQFVSKSELERARLIREARAIYESIFPPPDPVRDDGEGEEAPGTQN